MATSRDTVDPYAMVGSLLQQNTDAGLFWVANHGSMCIHQGEPYVAWTELRDADAHEEKGPYVARWNGSDWELLPDTGDALIPDWAGSQLDFQGPEFWGPGVMVARGDPSLASDGTNLYLAVKGAIAWKYVLHPGPPPVFYYVPRWSILVWQWDGATWTEYGPGFVSGTGDVGVFSVAGWQTYGGGSDVHGSQLSLVASADMPGGCYLAYSDASDLSVSGAAEFGPGARLVAVGLGAAALPETLIEENFAQLSADGVDSEFAVYYTLSFYPTVDDSQLKVWTQDGTLEIPAADFPGPSFTGAHVANPAASPNGSERILVVHVEDAGRDNAATLIYRVDPSSPDVLLDLVSGRPALDLIGEHATALSAAPTPLERCTFQDGTKNFWFVYDENGIRQISQLDRQCIASNNWFGVGENLGVDVGLPVIFDGESFWAFSAVNNVDDPTLFAAKPNQAIVIKADICRGCLPCARTGLHVWKRL
jgi:hypothetical protein